MQRLRLAQAAQRLTDAAGTVTAVAHDAGYDSPQAFARAFRGFTGVTPSEPVRLDICKDNPAVDRNAVHAQTAERALAFFAAALPVSHA